MKKKKIIAATIVFFSIVIIVCLNTAKKHTFTISNDESTIKEEQIQPLWGTVKVSSDSYTDVIFTDVETGEQYLIGYITQGITEKISLERNKWYSVEGRGNLMLSPVNIRVE